jgi:very-short-patch-repair endonuclease
MKPRNPLNIYAKELRNNSTDTERLLWRHLRNSQLEGVKFCRQQPIETYIVDFVSFEKRIVIELLPPPPRPPPARGGGVNVQTP